mmetsp:Transcript_19627/g.39233  ORF Transcript_19627/g.39233 Transcript_19627/m.39233 type:complete len:208 (+) Transcript_19627:1095-1718(+)
MGTLKMLRRATTLMRGQPLMSSSPIPISTSAFLSVAPSGSVCPTILRPSSTSLMTTLPVFSSSTTIIPKPIPGGPLVMVALIVMCLYFFSCSSSSRVLVMISYASVTCLNMSASPPLSGWARRAAFLYARSICFRVGLVVGSRFRASQYGVRSGLPLTSPSFILLAFSMASSQVNFSCSLSALRYRGRRSSCRITQQCFLLAWAIMR